MVERLDQAKEEGYYTTWERRIERTSMTKKMRSEFSL
jgi:hypothetical protein